MLILETYFDYEKEAGHRPAELLVSKILILDHYDLITQNQIALFPMWRKKKREIFILI